MRRISVTTSLAVATLIGMVVNAPAFIPTVFAQDESITAATERSEREVVGRDLLDEKVGVKPQAGVLVFTDSARNTDSRLAAGLSAEWNMIASLYKGPKELKNFYIGPSTGVFFSHLGAADSNFFGGNAVAGASQTGSNFLLVPVNLKVGYLFPDTEFRLSLRAGGNITYRSIANSLSLGASTAGSASAWRMYPNIGADFEYKQLVVRPDLTITPGDQIFSGTLGLNIPLG